MTPNDALTIGQVGCIIAAVVYGFALLRRLVKAHERIADALESVARKSGEGGK